MALDKFRKVNITLNKANQRVLETQIAKVGDANGRELVVQITNNGIIEDQTGTTLKLNWQHENGKQGSTNFKVVDIKTGRFSIYYPTEMLYKGKVNANIEITSNGQITNSMNFKIIVQADVFDGEAGNVDGVFISLAEVNKKLDDREAEYVELKSRQTSVESQFDEIQQSLTDKDVISGPEIIAARDGEPTLNDRLDKEHQEVTTQLAQTMSNVKTEGAVADGINDDTQFFNLAQQKNYDVIFPTDTYRMTKFQGVPYKHIDGKGSTIQLYKKDSPVLIGFHDNTLYENIVFECMETDLELVRASLENRHNVILRNCTFKGFRNPTSSNAWGLYLKYCTNITIINCRFGDNTQSDIAILEGSKNITIISPMGLDENTYPVINIEPNNALDIIENVNIISGKIETLYALENWSGYSSQNIVVQGCTIKNLVYDGTGIEFIGCRILNGLNAPTSGNIWAGQVNFNDSLVLGKNLLEDSRLLSISYKDDSTNWKVNYSTVPGGNLYRRLNDDVLGRFLRLNPDSLNGVIRINPKSRIPVSPNEKYLFSITGRAIYPTSAVHMSKNAKVSFYDSDGTLINSQTIYIFKGSQNETTGVGTESVLIAVPENASEMNLQIGFFSTSNNQLDIVAVSLHKIIFSNGNRGNTKELEKIHTLTNGSIEAVVDVQSLPLGTSTNYYANLELGDKLIPKNPQSGSYMEYVCVGTDVNNKPIMKGVGMIEA